MLVITTTFNYPAAVGEARTVEPHKEGLTREKPANTTILQSSSRALSIRPHSFSYKPILKMPISKDEFRSINEDGASLPDLAPDTTQGAVYRFLLGHADQAFRQREIVDAVDELCSCPDWQQRSPEGGCKHLRPVNHEIKRGRVPRPDDRLPSP